MDTFELEQIQRHMVPISLQKALALSKKFWGRIEWDFLSQLGFLQHISREQIEVIYSQLHSTRNTLKDS
jgi:hypothetical protein